MDSTIRIKSDIHWLTTTAIPLALTTLALSMGLPEVYAQLTLVTSVTIDSAQLNRDGTVTVVYTVECSGDDATLIQTQAQVEQTSGRGGGIRVEGIDNENPNVPCDENGVQLTSLVVAQAGFFVPGRATVGAFAVACTDEECNDDIESEVVRLSR